MRTSSSENKNDVLLTDEGAHTRRLKIVQEIVQTEMNYINTLGIVIRVFLDPLRMANLVPLVTVHTIFCDFEVFQVLHTHLNDGLESRLSTWDPIRTKIGDLFLREV